MSLGLKASVLSPAAASIPRYHTGEPKQRVYLPGTVIFRRESSRFPLGALLQAAFMNTPCAFCVRKAHPLDHAPCSPHPPPMLVLEGKVHGSR